jgi:DNA-binding transcriptional regulator/RsmH inhibitor MraZ
MSNVEFQAKVENGKIVIPEEYQQELSAVDTVKITISNKLQRNTAEAWEKWFESAERLEVTSHEPAKEEHQQLLLNKYRQQGLEL